MERFEHISEQPKNEEVPIHEEKKTNARSDADENTLPLFTDPPLSVQVEQQPWPSTSETTEEQQRRSTPKPANSETNAEPHKDAFTADRDETDQFIHFPGIVEKMKHSQLLLELHRKIYQVCGITITLILERVKVSCKQRKGMKRNPVEWISNKKKTFNFSGWNADKCILAFFSAAVVVVVLVFAIVHWNICLLSMTFSDHKVRMFSETGTRHSHAWKGENLCADFKSDCAGSRSDCLSSGQCTKKHNGAGSLLLVAFAALPCLVMGLQSTVLRNTWKEMQHFISERAHLEKLEPESESEEEHKKIKASGTLWKVPDCPVNSHDYLCWDPEVHDCFKKSPMQKSLGDCSPFMCLHDIWQDIYADESNRMNDVDQIYGEKVHVGQDGEDIIGKLGSEENAEDQKEFIKCSDIGVGSVETSNCLSQSGGHGSEGLVGDYKDTEKPLGIDEADEEYEEVSSVPHRHCLHYFAETCGHHVPRRAKNQRRGRPKQIPDLEKFLAQFCMAGEECSMCLWNFLDIPTYFTPVLTEVAVYPAFVACRELDRLASFKGCPVQQPVAPLAKAGFYHTGHGEEVKCFSCDIAWTKWNPLWDPVNKHSETCHFAQRRDESNIPFAPNFFNSDRAAIERAHEKFGLNDIHSKVMSLNEQSRKSLTSTKDVVSREHSQNSLCGETTGEPDVTSVEDTGASEVTTFDPEARPAGLRYYVHSYDETGQPRSESQTMDYISSEKGNPLMKDERERLSSFVRWPSTSVMKPAELARAGFYYAGSGDRVRCAFCNGLLKNWTAGDRAADEHKRHYPTCPFMLNLNVGNKPLRKDDVPMKGPVYASTHDKHAPLSTGKRKRMAVPEARSYGQPLHASSPGGENAGSSLSNPKYLPGTILIPKSNNFSSYESRMITFDSWPRRDPPKKEDLAQAGFYYIGRDDNVRCFHCDGGLRNWLVTDIPWIEHAKWFPRCGFLQMEKGRNFIEQHGQQSSGASATFSQETRKDITNALRPASLPTPGNQQNVGATLIPQNAEASKSPQQGFDIQAREVRARFDTHQAQMVREMGFPEAVLKFVILKKLKDTGDDFANAQSLMEAIFDEEANVASYGIEHYEELLDKEFGKKPDVRQQAHTSKHTAAATESNEEKLMEINIAETSGDERSIIEENRQLKEQTTCKICMDKEVSVVFVPCGHLVCCDKCAPSMKQCPICRRKITNTIRTFMS